MIKVLQQTMYIIIKTHGIKILLKHEEKKLAIHILNKTHFV